LRGYRVRNGTELSLCHISAGARPKKFSSWTNQLIRQIKEKAIASTTKRSVEMVIGLSGKEAISSFCQLNVRGLKEERTKILSNIMTTAYIPVRMEQFPAFDEKQLEYIKKVIDDTDYYVLVIKARYGSVNTAGVSFTEEEYDYAVKLWLTAITSSFVHIITELRSLAETQAQPS
jgi:hypothetical protein